MPASTPVWLERGHMGTTVALANSKGGVGKSTVSVHLAAWTHEQGLRTGLVDADVQGASSLWLHEAVPEIPLPSSRACAPDPPRMPSAQVAP
ncbi:MAG: ParA family protein [Limisphaerales bacterium]